MDAVLLIMHHQHILIFFMGFVRVVFLLCHERLMEYHEEIGLNLFGRFGTVMLLYQRRMVVFLYIVRIRQFHINTSQPFCYALFY